ncbi:MAG: FAD-dependent oxidoreductase, partial [Alphaproteobacteria bacterium]
SSFRPYRYNSTPLIGKIESLPNFYLNVGHGSLGWTNSLASGKIVADEISENHHKDFKFLSDDLKNIFTNQ